MKKFLKDNTRETQSLSKEIIMDIFGYSEANAKEAIKSPLIVLHSFSDNEMSFQICFVNYQNLNNNYYSVFGFDKNDEIILKFGYPSHASYPPVWDREFGNIDYFDFLGIQLEINKVLNRNNLPLINIDILPNGKNFYFTKEKPVEVVELLKKGQSYQIISLFAEKHPDLVDSAKKHLGI